MKPEQGIALMQHQVEGVEFLLDRRSGLIAFEQGLGKTLVAIEAFRRLLSVSEADAMIVICPNSLKRTWATELGRFAPELTLHIVEGAPQARRIALSTTIATVVIVNYECARNEIIAIQALMHRRRTVLVMDESHYVKNYRSLNATAAQHFSPLTVHRWLLSGTPVTNNPVDIYPQLCLVAGGQPFGSFAAFESKYGDKKAPVSEREGLGERIRPYLLRRTKEECLDLPEKTFVDVMVELPQWQQRLYRAMRDELLIQVKGMSAEQFQRFAPTAMTRLLRLSQIASNPSLLLPDEDRVPGKFSELDRIIDEIVGKNRRKIILWSHYVKTIETLTRRYSNFGTASLFGGTPQEDRQHIASQFQNDSSLMILIANPAAAGTGFTLTAASYAIYETLTWRYDYYAQSQDRNHRIGQKNAVTYIRLIANETIEQAIVEALQHKAQMAREILGDATPNGRASAMTPAIFCEILRSGRIPESIFS